MSNLQKHNGNSIEIREVWNHNLEEEFLLIRSIVDDYPFVGIDTEFPGVALGPTGTFRSFKDFNYQTLKINVNNLKVIQVGLTFSDSSGHLPRFGSPPRPCVWQFNFCDFDPATDLFMAESIELLRRSGIDLDKNRRLGVAAARFAGLFLSSGVLLNDSVHWITFHSGYDFGYLLKMLTRQDLPDNQKEFFDCLRLYFPRVYYVKHLMKFCNNLHGGLNKLAELLEVERVGRCHQAGSDSLLISATFRKLKDCYLDGYTERYAGVLYGLGTD